MGEVSHHTYAEGSARVRARCIIKESPREARLLEPDLTREADLRCGLP